MSLLLRTMWLVLAAPIPAFACPSTLADLSVAVVAAERSPMDIEPGAALDLQQTLGCLRDRPPATLLARAYAALAMDAWARGDHVSVEAWFCGTHALDPAYDFPSWVPSGTGEGAHELRRAHHGALCSENGASVSASSDLVLFVDGSPGNEVPGNPAARPYLFQAYNLDREPVRTALVGRGASPPDLPLAAPTLAVPNEPPSRNRRLVPGLAIGGAGTAILATSATVAMLYMASVNPNTPLSEQEQKNLQRVVVPGMIVGGAAMVGGGVFALSGRTSTAGTAPVTVGVRGRF